MKLLSDTKIFVAGHQGLVGSAVCRELRRRGLGNIVVRSKAELDLRNQARVSEFFETERPACVVLAAAKVGGIGANASYPAQFIYDNLAIATNVIQAAKQCGVQKLLNLGSSCIYPKLAPDPIEEDALLSGSLEPTNRPYAIAKIAAIELCDSYRKQYGCDFISAMPTNLYGPGDNFDLETSHVLPALIRKFHEAKLRGDCEVVLWGSGVARREFLYVDDLARACLHLLEHYSEAGPINVGCGDDISIRDLARLVGGIVGYDAEVRWDTSKPDGTLRKRLDTSRLTALGFTASVDLEEGVRRTYEWYLEHPQA